MGEGEVRHQLHARVVRQHVHLNHAGAPYLSSRTRRWHRVPYLCTWTRAQPHRVLVGLRISHRARRLARRHVHLPPPPSPHIQPPPIPARTVALVTPHPDRPRPPALPPPPPALASPAAARASREPSRSRPPTRRGPQPRHPPPGRARPCPVPPPAGDPLPSLYAGTAAGRRGARLGVGGGREQVPDLLRRVRYQLRPGPARSCARRTAPHPPVWRPGCPSPAAARQPPPRTGSRPPCMR